jgi:large subunit ribosomal protein L15
MLAHELRPPKGAKQARKRVGRGNASGRGTYSGRGLKGQKARSGRKPKLGFEGGQTRLIKRLPRRRGFTNIFRKEYSAVNLRDLERFEAGTEVTPELLKQSGVVRSLRRPLKVLASGELTKALTVKAHKFSTSAKEKIEAAGGSALEIGDGDGG